MAVDGKFRINTFNGSKQHEWEIKLDVIVSFVKIVFFLIFNEKYPFWICQKQTNFSAEIGGIKDSKQ